MKLKYTFILAFSIVTNIAFCQNDHSGNPLDVLIDPIISPVFPGGEAGLLKYLEESKNKVHELDHVKGTVYVGFLVEVDGKVKDIKVLQSDCIPCDKTAMKIVENMPDWIPATQYGMRIP